MQSSLPASLAHDVNEIEDDYLLTNLDKWVLRHCKQNGEDERETFYDSNGIKRFVETWLPAYENNPCVDTRHNDIGIYPLFSGCVDVNVDIENAIQSSNLYTKPGNRVIKSMRFVQDWRRLWRYYASDRSDEISQCIPLLRSCIEFIFHRRTAQMMCIVELYGTILYIALSENDTAFVRSIWSKALAYPYHILELLFYLMMYSMLKGSPSDIFASNGTPNMSNAANSKKCDCDDEQSKDDVTNVSGLHSSSTGSVDLPPAIAKSMEAIHTVSCLRTFVKLLRDIKTDAKYIFASDTTNKHKSPLPNRRPTQYGQSSQPSTPLLHDDTTKNREEMGHVIAKPTFYELLNISMKFLVGYGRVDLRKKLANDNFYRIMLLIVCYLVPTSLVIQRCIFSRFSLEVVFGQCPDELTASTCELIRLQFWLRLMYLTDLIPSMIFASSVYVAFITLFLGAEIAFRLAKCWIHRFGALRLVDIEDYMEEDDDTDKDDSTTKPSPVKQPFRASIPPGIVANNSNNNEDNTMSTPSPQLLQRTSVPSISPTSIAGISMSSVREQVRRSSRHHPRVSLQIRRPSSRAPTGDISVMSSADAFDRDNQRNELENVPYPIDLQILSGQSTADIEIGKSTSNPLLWDNSNNHRRADENIEEYNAIVTNGSVTPSSLLLFIQRDAFEHYFFIHEFNSQASDIWSPVLLGMIALCIYLVSGYVTEYALLFTSGYFARHVFQAAVLGLLILYRASLLAVLPIVAIARANTFSGTLVNTFANSSPEDFTLLGGRDLWIDFFESTPVVWTFYGLWITWERLSGLLWGATVTVGTAVGTFVTTYNVSPSKSS